ncbi:hypothetical protein HDE_10350 [Halotydeus destructor]|nr:hypothetical protein HDE_10350 [Halotydeus destructor]
MTLSTFSLLIFAIYVVNCNTLYEQQYGLVPDPEEVEEFKTHRKIHEELLKKNQTEREKDRQAADDRYHFRQTNLAYLSATFLGSLTVVFGTLYIFFAICETKPVARRVTQYETPIMPRVAFNEPVMYPQIINQSLNVPQNGYPIMQNVNYFVPPAYVVEDKHSNMIGM